jgi:hypothetical protein
MVDIWHQVSSLSDDFCFYLLHAGGLKQGTMHGKKGQETQQEVISE